MRATCWRFVGVAILASSLLLASGCIAEEDPKKPEKEPGGIYLPEATTKKSIVDSKDDVHFIVDEKGRITPAGEAAPIEGKEKLQKYMNSLYEKLKAQGGDKKIKETKIVIRGHHETDFDHIYDVMLAAKEAGFSNIQLRANIPNKK
jgi:biopolymer transport protein ExbD